jgi:hypothetical protein
MLMYQAMLRKLSELNEQLERIQGGAVSGDAREPPLGKADLQERLGVPLSASTPAAPQVRIRAEGTVKDQLATHLREL